MPSGLMDVDKFLESCKESGNQAYSNFKNVLENLHNPDTRGAARRFLSEVEEKTKSVENALAAFNFRIHHLSLSEFEGCAKERMAGDAARQELVLLEMSSIFMPEDWSFTFYEGLTRHPDSGFFGRDIAELGCGNGWISIALAERWAPRKVYGLDINPRAIKIAWINLYLNALRGDGTPVVDHDGKTLLDRVEFYVSDLLQVIREKNIQLDRVVGCIPQVLTPDPKAALKMVSETMSEEFLHSLSNYCSLQGYVEDQFGLGLIARAVEEAMGVVRPTGALILNMGGRPGRNVCERLFERRGFRIHRLWHTRVNQAADTDIMALVEIERESRHRFEFFMGQSACASDDPISARSALLFAKAGGTIAHGLSVYECRLRHPNHVKAIFKFLQQDGYQDTRSALDLSFTNDALADEKISFLAHLAQSLQSTAHLPADLALGSRKFRMQIASFLRLYFRIPLSAKNIEILPTRALAVENIIRLYAPSLALVETELTKSIPKKWLRSLPNEASPVVLQVPKRSDLVLMMARALRPQIIVTSLADFEMRSSTALQLLLDTAADVGARIFIDISEHLDLSSSPSPNGVLQFLSLHPLPPHASIICGLVKNQVYSDLEVCFVVSESRPFLDALRRSGEMTVLRTAAIKQLFYGCLFHDLLSFQMPERYHATTRPLCEADGDGKFIRINAGVEAAMAHSTPEDEFTCATSEGEDIKRGGESHPPANGAAPLGALRMDVVVNALGSPQPVKRFVYEAFVRQHVSEPEMDPRPELLQLVCKWFKMDMLGSSPPTIVAGDGATVLFSSLAKIAAETRAEIVFEAGSNAHFIASAKFHGARTSTVATSASNGFKLSPDIVSAQLQGATNPWLFFSAPVESPTGAVYSPPEFRAVLETCRKFGAKVIIDASFAGMQFSSASERPDLTEFFGQHSEDSSAKSSFSVTILGDLSAELSMESFLFGFAVVEDPIFVDGLASAALPHGTLRYAIKKIVNLMNQQEENPLTTELEKRRRLLQDRSKALFQVLVEAGWEPVEPRGGVSLVARPKEYEGGSFALDGRTITLDSETISAALSSAMGLHINNSTQTGIPNFCRFILSTEEKVFSSGLDCLRKFRDLVFSQGDKA